MTHLSREELRRWRDAPEATDRVRVVGHLATCDACGGVLAELVRSRPLEASADTSGAEAARRHGYAARKTVSFAPRPMLLAAGVGALAAALAFLLARGPSPDDTALRGTELRAIEPAGEVARPFTFRWESPVSATSYRVDVYDGAGDRVHSEQAPASPLQADALGPRLVPGDRYAWDVTALDAGGQPLLTSERRSFVVRAP